ncbi:MAG: BT_3928 family protein [Marinifilaceae bacterium]
MKVFATICRLLIAITFLYSGFVKAVDPSGLEYKLIEYFNAFGLESLRPLALVGSFMMSAVELLIGALMLLTVQMRVATFLALCFMAVATPVTLYIAIVNPVSDCGCFGDALKISNWETFAKNVVLLFSAVFAFYYRQKYRSPFNIMEQIVLCMLFIIGAVALQGYCYRYLPILDFRPYHVGAHLQARNTVGGMEEQVILKYRNKQTNDVVKFTEDNYPWQDTLNWEFVDTESVMQERKQNSFSQTNFYVESAELGDISSFIAQDNGYSFLLTSPNMLQMDTVGKMANIKVLAEAINNNGHKLYFLTATSAETASEFIYDNEIQAEVGTMDETELKTMVRSNPGLLLIKDGVIINKWSINNLPTPQWMESESLLSQNILETQRSNINYRIISGIFIFILLLVAYLCGTRVTRRTRRF